LISDSRSELNKSRLQTLSPESFSDNPSLPPIDLNFSSSSKNLRRYGLVNNGHTRSILRKQTSISPSNTSTDVPNRKLHRRIVTPSSTFVDTIPLGTRSQRLFGGSECFAQIMNELEQQKETY
jgi:hypothetical protein